MYTLQSRCISRASVDRAILGVFNDFGGKSCALQAVWRMVCA